MTTFSFRMAFDEVRRNLASARLRTATLVAVSVAMGAVVTLATVADVTRVATVAERQYVAGSSALEIVGPSGDRVDAMRCHALESMDGVAAAGGVMHTTTTRLGSQPDADTRLFTVTPGYIATAWPTLPHARTASVLAGPYYEGLGWRAGEIIQYSSRHDARNVTRVDAVADEVSVQGLDRIIAAVAPPNGTVNSCLVLATPAARAAVAQAVRGWFGPGTSVTDVYVRSDLVQDPQTMLDTRLSRFGWAVGGAVLAAAMLSHWVARRSEFALYRLHHVPDSGILAMFTWETFLLVLVPVQAGALIGLGVRSVDELLAVSLVVDWLRLNLVILLVPLMGLLAVPRGSVLATLKGQ